MILEKLDPRGIFAPTPGHYTCILQGSKCPSLPGFTHGFYPGKPGLGFKPYFEKVGT